jgi:F-type H+-transporting ATPase subunit epsilon
MADTTEFELVSPERLLVSEPVEMVVVPGAEGDFGVLPGHAPFISTLRPGVITIYENRQPKEAIFVAGGVAEVTPERCTVLAEEAIRIAEADRADVQRRVQEAREALASCAEEEKEAALKRVHIAEALVSAVDRGLGGVPSH